MFPSRQPNRRLRKGLHTGMGGVCIVTLLMVSGAAWADPAADRAAVLQALAAQAQKDDPGFKGFDVARGKELFTSTHAGGKPQTPSCLTCHTSDLTQPGKTRAGKVIEPMALSRTPSRFSDLDKIEKWFRRNCKTVMGRACTAQEKGDVLTFLATQ